MTSWSLLDDPEPPPQPWWIWLLGAASVLVVGAGGVVALVGHGNNHHRTVAREPAPISRPACDPEKGRGLYQLGATPRDWAREHTVVYDPNHPRSLPRWDPDPSLPRVDGQQGAVYNQVKTYEDCTIDSYYVQLPHQTRPAAALRRATDELPADAKVLWHRRLSQCVQYEFTSSAVVSQLRRRGDNRFGSAGALVNLVEARADDVSSVTRIGLALTEATIPSATHGCVD